MFEWCETCRALEGVLEQSLAEANRLKARDDAVKVLVVGCGTSELSAKLWEEGLRKVHSVDIDPSAIALMRDMYTDHKGLTWQVLDLTATPFKQLATSEAGGGASADERLDDSVYSLAVDKGTLDYFLCGEAEHAIDALANVHAALLDQGYMLLISLHPLELMRTVFKGSELAFEEVRAWIVADTADGPLEVTSLAVSSEEVRANYSSASSSAMLLRCLPRERPWTPEQRSVAQRHLVNSLDAYFGSATPMLTPAREASLRMSWQAALEEQRIAAAASASSSRNDDDGETEVTKALLRSDRLPVETTYKLVFDSPMEREEYSLDYFLEDLQATGFDATRGLTLLEALLFLQKNQ